MTSSMSGGRRPNGPPPRLPPPPPLPHGPPPPPPPLPQGPPLLLFHAIRTSRPTRGTFAFKPGCIYVTAAIPSIKRRAGDMAEITESAVRGVLETVIDPATGRNVVATGMVSGIATRGGH